MTLAARFKEVLALADNAEALHKASPMMMNTPDSVHAYDVAADAAYNLIRSPDFAGLVERLDAAEARANLYEARYCRVRDLHNTFQHYVDGELVRVDKIDDTVYDASIDGLIADAQEQIDAAMQSKPDQETGAGE